MNINSERDEQLTAALQRAAEAVDWPAFGRRLRTRLSDVTPVRHMTWAVVGAGVRLMAAAGLVAVAVWCSGLWRTVKPAQNAAPPALTSRAEEVRDLLAQLPAGGIDEGWITRRLRTPIR